MYFGKDISSVYGKIDLQLDKMRVRILSTFQEPGPWLCTFRFYVAVNGSGLTYIKLLHKGHFMNKPKGRFLN